MVQAGEAGLMLACFQLHLSESPPGHGRSGWRCDGGFAHGLSTGVVEHGRHIDLITSAVDAPKLRQCVPFGLEQLEKVREGHAAGDGPRDLDAMLAAEAEG